MNAPSEEKKQQPRTCIHCVLLYPVSASGTEASHLVHANGIRREDRMAEGSTDVAPQMSNSTLGPESEVDWRNAAYRSHSL